MTTALYQKYRPVTFDDVIGQDHIVTTIRHQISNNTPAHAYLFYGIQGVGKTTIARLIARDLKTADLDFVELDAASHRGVDEIEELIQSAQYAPSQSDYKVYIIDEVHMLTKHAFNALLKTLEEPPSHAIFILATTEIDKVPATIISRSQRFDFKRVTQSDLIRRVKKLVKEEKRDITDEAAALIATAGQGSVRDTESTLDKVLDNISDKKVDVAEAESALGLVGSQAIAELFSLCLEGKSKDALEKFNELYSDSMNLHSFFFQLIDWSRKVWLAKLDEKLIDIEERPDAELKLIKEQSQSVESETLSKIINTLVKYDSQVSLFPIPKMAAEVALVEVSALNMAEKNVR